MLNRLYRNRKRANESGAAAVESEDHLGIYLRLLHFVRPYRRRLIVAMACMVLAAGLHALSMYLIKPVVDDIFASRNEQMLLLLPGLIVVVFFVKGLADYSQNYLTRSVGQRVIRDIRNLMFATLQRLSLSFYHRERTGSLMSRILNDVAMLEGAVSSILSTALKEGFTAIGLVCLLFYLDWKLALIAIVVFPIAMIPIVRFARKMRRAARASQENMADLSAVLQETFSGIQIVQAFRTEAYEGRRFERVTQAFYTNVMRAIRADAASTPVTELLGAVGVAGVIYYGGRQVFAGALTGGDFFAFLAAALALYRPAKKFSKVNYLLQSGLAAGRRIFDLLDTQPDIGERPGAVAVPPIADAIHFDAVRFSYGDDEVLCGVDFTIERGQVVAVVGPSGAGKSTIINLIPRFFDATGGAIRIDGHDIRDATLASLRGQIGLVTQETVLFHDSVRANIAYGLGGVSEQAIIDAAVAAYALEFIQDLPRGFDTVIGERGVRLSGGQRQRLAIARALLKDPPILLLDEATSALDTESETIVQKALANLMRGRTTLVVAHRLSTVRGADKILVLSQGRIVEHGAHNDLLLQRGAYWKLYNAVVV